MAARRRSVSRGGKHSARSSGRSLVIGIVLLVIAAVGAYLFVRRPVPVAGGTVTVYYSKLDGTTLGSYAVTLGSARDVRSVAFYAATQALAGPASGTSAIRFPAGTHVLNLDVNGKTADVDISKEIESSASGGFAESGEFKALVWTLTAIPGISSVQVRINGSRLATLPGGHFELDEPLSRENW